MFPNERNELELQPFFSDHQCHSLLQAGMRLIINPIHDFITMVILVILSVQNNSAYSVFGFRTIETKGNTCTIKHFQWVFQQLK